MRVKQIAQKGMIVERADIHPLRRLLLGWYDGNRRDLPWRAAPGRNANPYHVWLSEIMLQQTTVAAVIPYFLKFIQKWPTIRHLSDASEQEVMDAWAGLGYYARARNLHSCAKIVSSENEGVFPQTVEELRKLPGIGDYTSAAIASIAFARPALGVDGNVERVLARVFAIGEKRDIQDKAKEISSGYADRPGDFAQALMDLGATVCIPRTPRCNLCPVSSMCGAQLRRMQDRYPVKFDKKPRPNRFGYVHWIENGKGRVLLERRERRGLLGNMTGFPTSEWNIGQPPEPLFSAAMNPEWLIEVDASPKFHVRQVFTHFNLQLTGFLWRIKGDFVLPERHFWHNFAENEAVRLPGLFRKFFLQVMDFKDI